MKRAPLIFLSYCQEYAELKDLVAQLLSDFGFRTEVFDYGSPHSVIDTEKELIETCDGFVALLTPDQETADGRHICSMSVNQEIGMAYQAGKPIQLFAFDHVDFTAVQASQVSTVAQVATLDGVEEATLTFDSTNLRNLVRALIEFRRRIRSLEGHRGDDAFFSYKTVAVRQDLMSPTELRLHNTIEAVSLKNLDTHTHAARLLCDKKEGPGIRLRDDSWQFKLIRPSGVDAAIRLTENTYSNFRFYIDFDPPIQAGVELKYAYRRRHESYLPYTAEELDDLILDGNLSNRVMAKNKMIGQDFFVTQPTESVSFHLQFPAGYPIRDFKSLVCEYRGDQVHHSETERVSELAELDHNEFDDEYVLRMEVPNPRVNCSYFLLYRPPREQDITT